jgi:hypothetical protein
MLLICKLGHECDWGNIHTLDKLIQTIVGLISIVAITINQTLPVEKADAGAY